MVSLPAYYSAHAQFATSSGTTTTLNKVGIGTTTIATNAQLDLQKGGLSIGDGNQNILDASFHIKTSYGGWDRLTQMAPSAPGKPGLNILGYTNPDASISWWSWGALASGTWAIQPEWHFGGESGFFVNRNGWMGVGVSNPMSKQHIKLDNEFIIIQRENSSNYAGHYYATGESNSLTYNFFTGLRENTNDYRVFNGQTATDALVIKSNNNYVGIGTLNPDAMLAVKGTIHTQEVKVDLNGWSDYVFKADYRLPSLTNVKAYIDKNHHLPDVPSEQEVAKQGVNLGEMNKLLLKKVEELTLYLFRQDQRLNAQDKKIKKLERNTKLIRKGN